MSCYAGPEIDEENLVAYFDAANVKCYPGSGTTCYDLSKLSSDFTLSNSPTYDSEGGGCFSLLASSSQSIYTASLYDLSITNAFTATVWAKSSTSTWNETGMLFSRRNQFIIHPTGGGTSVSYYVHFNNTTWTAGGTGGIADITKFNEFTFSYQDGYLYGYLNGKSVGTWGAGTWTPLTSDTGNTYLGHDDGQATRYLTGKIALAKVYNIKLSSDQIWQNYQAHKGRFNL